MTDNIYNVQGEGDAGLKKGLGSATIRQQRAGQPISASHLNSVIDNVNRLTTNIGGFRQMNRQRQGESNLPAIKVFNNTGDSLDVGMVVALDPSTAAVDKNECTIIDLDTSRKKAHLAVVLTDMHNQQTGFVQTDGLVQTRVDYNASADLFAKPQTSGTAFESTPYPTNYPIIAKGELISGTIYNAVVQLMPLIVRRLAIVQGNASMPADGAFFGPKYAVDHDYTIEKAWVKNTSGNFSVQMEVGGTLSGPTLTQTSSGTDTNVSSVSWDNGVALRLKVNSSSSCLGFEFNALCVEH